MAIVHSIPERFANLPDFNSLTTRTEVGAGEAMVNHALVKLYQMLGKLRSVPSQ